MLQTSDIGNWGIVAKKREKATSLALLLDFIRDFKATPHRGREPILQTMGKIAKFVAFLLYWRENRFFPVSPPDVGFSHVDT
jgi:hypothetical protein